MEEFKNLVKKALKSMPKESKPQMIIVGSFDEWRALVLSKEEDNFLNTIRIIDFNKNPVGCFMGVDVFINPLIEPGKFYIK